MASLIHDTSSILRHSLQQSHVLWFQRCHTFYILLTIIHDIVMQDSIIIIPILLLYCSRSRIINYQSQITHHPAKNVIKTKKISMQ